MKIKIIISTILLTLLSGVSYAKNSQEMCGVVIKQAASQGWSGLSSEIYSLVSEPDQTNNSKVLKLSFDNDNIKNQISESVFETLCLDVNLVSGGWSGTKANKLHVKGIIK